MFIVYYCQCSAGCLKMKGKSKQYLDGSFGQYTGNSFLSLKEPFYCICVCVVVADELICLAAVLFVIDDRYAEFPASYSGITVIQSVRHFSVQQVSSA